MQLILLPHIFTPTNNGSFVTFIISLGTCTCKVATAPRFPALPPPPFLLLWWGEVIKNFTKSELNKQKSCINAGYPLNNLNTTSVTTSSEESYVMN